MARKQKDETGQNSYGRLVNNLRFGTKSSRLGEGLIVFCIGRLAELDHRTRRYIMCDLIMYGLKNSPNYSKYFEQLQKEFDEQSASVAAATE